MARSMPGRATAHHNGFTLIEMITVVGILMLMASLVMPGLVAIKRSRDRQDLEASLARFPVLAKNLAARDGVPMSLRFEGSDLVIEQTPADTDPQTTDGGQTVKRLSLNGMLNPTRAERNGEGIDLASWKWTVYPDGSADRAGVEFSDGAATHSLILPGTDRVSGSDHIRWIDGGLPDTSEEIWSAGEIEKRG